MLASMSGTAIGSKASRSVVSRASVRVQANARVDKCKKTEVMVSPSILSANFSKLGEEVRSH